MNNNNEKFEFIESMFASISQIDASRIIGKRITLYPRGRHHMGLCPFHGDHKLGSFVVTDGKGNYKCFACGAGGNAIGFVSKYEGKKYLEAAFDIALEEGVISQMQYDKYSKKKYDADAVKNLQKKYETQKKGVESKYVNPEVLQNVYTFMRDYAGINEGHKNHLIKERHLSEERLEKDYFSFPYNRKHKLIEALREKYPEYSREVLQDIPGFFYNREKSELTYAGYKGIGILMRGADGKVRGIQIRRDTVKEGEHRYMWFASTFALYDREKYSGGNTIGSPIDVLYPRKIRNNYPICIAEGRFKTEILAEQGNFAVSVQGVGNFANIDKDISRIVSVKAYGCKSIYVFYDADMLGNIAVFTQCMRLTKYLQERISLSIKVACWKPELGKGIDDLFLNNGADSIKYFSPAELNSIHQKVLKSTLVEFGAERVVDVSEDKRKSFCATLCHRMEDNLFGI